jgi:hypothetical protein
MNYLNRNSKEVEGREIKRKSFQEFVPGAGDQKINRKRGGKRDEQFFEEESGYEPLDPKSGQGVDIGLMIYTLRKKQRKIQLIRDFIFCYLPYVILMVLWLTFSSFIFDAFWLNDGLKALLLRKEIKKIEIKRTWQDIGNGRDYWQVRNKF